MSGIAIGWAIRRVGMGGLRVLGVVSGVLFALSPSWAFAYTEFYIDSSPGQGEVITGYVLNEFQQDVGASSGCQMTTDEKAADFILEVVSIVDDTGSQGQNDSSAYSVTLVDSNNNYVSSMVGICGSDKVQTCGDNLFREMVHDLPSNVTSC
jgi:hypothetical protein